MSKRTSQEILHDAEKLVKWYQANRRPLPWRASKDPYRIWVSEIMLQQTTVAAVIPFYEKFMTLFPTVAHLADAPEEKVLAAWAGLGYYSRARNLHKSAKILKQGFPRTRAELIELPGLGPYTAAAVASIAFDEAAGILDGNVIRVLCRRFGWEIPWWKSAERAKLQVHADEFAAAAPPAEVNQALMELGATVCTPQNPSCLLCPWAKTCEAREQSLTDRVPLPKPRREKEIWLWEPRVHVRKGEVALTKDTAAPVLKNDWLFPGEFRKVARKPKVFHAQHGITHHDIYVVLKPGTKRPPASARWVPLHQLSEVNPSSLLKKVLQAVERR